MSGRNSAPGGGGKSGTAFAPTGLSHPFLIPRTCARGYMLPPLRGYGP